MWYWWTALLCIALFLLHCHVYCPVHCHAHCHVYCPVHCNAHCHVYCPVHCHDCHNCNIKNNTKPSQTKTVFSPRKKHRLAPLYQNIDLLTPLKNALFVNPQFFIIIWASHVLWKLLLISIYLKGAELQKEVSKDFWGRWLLSNSLKEAVKQNKTYLLSSIFFKNYIPVKLNLLDIIKNRSKEKYIHLSSCKVQ